MSIGLGKRYMVRLVKHHDGDLDSCLKFMADNKPLNDKQWFELRPLPVIKKGHAISCIEYMCNLVEDYE